MGKAKPKPAAEAEVAYLRARLALEREIAALKLEITSRGGKPAAPGTMRIRWVKLRRGRTNRRAG